MKIVLIIIVTGLLLIGIVMAFIVPRLHLKVRQDMMLRFSLVALLFLFLFCLIPYRTAVLMYEEGDELRALGARHERIKEDTIPARRGNLYADDGKMLSSSLPFYKVFMDMRVEGLRTPFNPKESDLSYFEHEVGALADSLAEVFHEKPARTLEREMRQAFLSHKAHYRLIQREISYLELQRISDFPILKRGAVQGGLSTEERSRRVWPFKPLASRTIGDVYGASNAGKNGLELFYNDSLQGHPGLKINRWVAGKRTDIITQPAVNGVDLATTINIDLQETAYKALLQALQAEDAECSTIVLMKCQTGEIKAISNLVRQNDGRYIEARNVAFGDEIEPGSTFKTVSLMVALDDGVIDTTYRVDTGNGRYNFYGSWMNDTHANGVISVPDILAQSSNVGVSRIIEEKYRNRPQQYIDGIHRTGLDQALSLEIPGHGSVKIKESTDKTWARTTLPWTSIGYEVNVPPIYTLMFYNAIANNGRMVKPKLVNAMLRDGDTIRTFPTEVVNQQICQPKTLGEIQSMLRRVVTHGTAKAVNTPLFEIAGKTGTSQIQTGGQKLTGEDGRPKHNITFCGYFPADHPEYSCIVYIRRPRVSSAGRICGGVFRTVAERAYALQNQTAEVDRKTLKQGRERLRECQEEERHSLPSQSCAVMPDMTGRTAREALYQLERSGWRVKLQGQGRVVSQSVAVGECPQPQETITLTLQ
ncbi:MAG: transpeptidase family protein [Paludibacteraceae bacterium]|nr:transpeptidase family protein [Paludibacteraceae bacterium]